MRNLLLAIPAILSFLVLAAHFFRSGQLLGVAICLGLPGFLLWRKVWAVRVVQIALTLGAVEWVRTAVEIAQAREAMGQPWTRMAVILGGVSLFTVGAALVLLLTRFRAPGGSEAPEAPRDGR